MGKELDKREWKRIRNKVIWVVSTEDKVIWVVSTEDKVIWVVSTEDKVILDFSITDRDPDHLQLIPLLDRIKDRLEEERIKSSDEKGTKEEIIHQLHKIISD
jgi:hypothetical protein